MNRTILNSHAGLPLVMAFLLGGCGSAKVSPVALPPPSIQPDKVIVHNFAVTMADVHLDKKVSDKALEDASESKLSAEEIKAGRLVADKLAEKLVEELDQAGIKALRAGNKDARPTPNSMIIEGQFMNIDEGHQSKRILIGFGVGGSNIRTQVEMIQNGNLVSFAQTTTKAGLKPGMLVSLGATVVTGGGAAPLVVSGASTGVNEAFLATIEADASRTAKALAQKIKNVYIAQNWLPGPAERKEEKIREVVGDAP